MTPTRRPTEVDLGKTEMWYVVAAEPGAVLLVRAEAGDRPAGAGERHCRGAFRKRWRSARTRAGDCFFIPAGTSPRARWRPDHLRDPAELGCGPTVSTIGGASASMVVRAGLHVQKSLDVIRYGADRNPRCLVQEMDVPGATVARLVTCPEFAAEKLVITGLLD